MDVEPVRQIGERHAQDPAPRGLVGGHTGPLEAIAADVVHAAPVGRDLGSFDLAQARAVVEEYTEVRGAQVVRLEVEEVDLALVAQVQGDRLARACRVELL